MTDDRTLADALVAMGIVRNDGEQYTVKHQGFWTYICDSGPLRVYDETLVTDSRVAMAAMKMIGGIYAHSEIPGKWHVYVETHGSVRLPVDHATDQDESLERAICVAVVEARAALDTGEIAAADTLDTFCVVCGIKTDDCADDGCPFGDIRAARRAAADRQKPRCPQCGGAIKKVRQDRNTSSLNADQFDAIRAGDYYCETCPDNGRGRSGLCYWWKGELLGPATTRRSDQ